MLKRLLGILFTLAALATFVWVALGSYTSWCSDGEEVVVDKTLPLPADTAAADTVSTDSALPAAPADSLALPAADTVR